MKEQFHFSLFTFHDKLLSIFLLFTIHYSLFTIEVGGHLTEDTIWSPENNPYEVTEVLYVDSGITLTILPGTEVKIESAPLTSWDDVEQNFSYNKVTVCRLGAFIWINRI